MTLRVVCGVLGSIFLIHLVANGRTPSERFVYLLLGTLLIATALGYAR